MIRIVVVLVCAALVVLIGQREAGYDAGHSVMLLLALAAVAVVCMHVPHGGRARWPEDRSVRRAGARDEVSTLSWSFFGRDSTVSSKGLSTLRGIAAGRLQHHGLDLDDPADADLARELLGADVYAILHGPPPSVRQLRRCVDALESADPRTRTVLSPRTSPSPRTAQPTRTVPPTRTSS